MTEPAHLFPIQLSLLHQHYAFVHIPLATIHVLQLVISESPCLLHRLLTYRRPQRLCLSSKTFVQRQNLLVSLQSTVQANTRELSCRSRNSQYITCSHPTLVLQLVLVNCTLCSPLNVSSSFTLSPPPTQCVCLEPSTVSPTLLCRVSDLHCNT